MFSGAAVKFKPPNADEMTLREDGSIGAEKGIPTTTRLADVEDLSMREAVLETSTAQRSKKFVIISKQWRNYKTSYSGIVYFSTQFCRLHMLLLIKQEVCLATFFAT